MSLTIQLSQRATLAVFVCVLLGGLLTMLTVAASSAPWWLQALAMTWTGGVLLSALLRWSFELDDETPVVVAGRRVAPPNPFERGGR